MGRFANRIHLHRRGLTAFLFALTTLGAQAQGLGELYQAALAGNPALKGREFEAERAEMIGGRERGHGLGMAFDDTRGFVIGANAERVAAVEFEAGGDRREDARDVGVGHGVDGSPRLRNIRTSRANSIQWVSSQ